MYCNAYFQKEEGSISNFSVVETKKVNDRMKYISFLVYFNEEEFEVKCACHLFEFKGILCRHILAMLNHMRKIELVPSKYVLSRWRKDMKQRYTSLKSNNHYTAALETQRLDKMCNAFYEVACMGANSDDDLMKVMNCINGLKVELSKTKASHQSIEASQLISDASMISQERTKVLDPLAVRSKGCPPSKRKESKVDQIVKSLRKKK